MKTCTHCGTSLANMKHHFAEPICQNCYIYFHKDRKHVEDLPEYGVVETYEGQPICHICGRYYRQLGTHIRQKHDMTTREYQTRFGLCYKGMLSPDLKALRSIQAIMNNMREILLVKGTQTRFKKGSAGNSRLCKERLTMLQRKGEKR